MVTTRRKSQVPLNAAEMPKATTSTADAAEELGVHPQKKVPPRRRSVRLRQEEKENASDGRRSNNPNNKRPMADDLGGQSKRANLEEDEEDPEMPEWSEEEALPKVFKGLADFADKIYYSNKYFCDDFEFRHVILPKDMMSLIPEEYRGRLLSETEWRRLGIRMSPGWVHYELHAPEPHIFLFKRPSTGE